MRVLALALAVLTATSALAAEPKQWTAAPVPDKVARPAVSPAERAGQTNGPANASPFSGVPTGAAVTGAPPTSAAPPGTHAATPSVSR